MALTELATTEVSLGEPSPARRLVSQSPIKVTPTKPMLRIYYVLSNCEFFFTKT